MNELVILVFLACGQPAYVELILPGGNVRLYSEKSSGQMWPVLLKDIQDFRKLGAEWHEYKIEDAVPIACGVGT